jgi:hypothetical protein
MMNVGSKFRVLKSSVVAALFALCLAPIPRLVAAPASAAKPSRVILDTLQPVLSDFDNDRKIDFASLRHSGGHKTIHITFGRSSWTALSFDSNSIDRGALVSSDINNDGDADLVWISTDTDQFIAWLGDGRGNFSVSRNHNIDPNELESLWWNFSPTSIEPENGSSPTAILTTTIWNVCDVPRCDLGLLPEIFRFHSTQLGVSLGFVCVPQLRGPPSFF